MDDWDDRHEFSNVVLIHPVRKDEDMVLLSFMTAEGEPVKLAIMSDVARHLATEMLLVAGKSSWSE